MYLPSEHQVAAELARRHFQDFVAFVRPEYKVAWFQAVLAETLEDWMLGKIPRLAVTMPPGHAKSEYGSRLLPAWGIGKFPDMKFIGASYAADLAQLMNRDVQAIMDTQEYMEIFPDVCLNGSNVRTVNGKAIRNSDAFEPMRPDGRRYKGAYRCAGVGGGLTGFRGDRLILDDPFKNREEADSPTIRNKVWDWFTQVFGTRKRKNAGELIILTRWHEDDVLGRAMARGGWEVLNLPAIMTEEDFEVRHPKDKRKIGEVLWPDQYPLEVIEERRVDLGARAFNALYQQRPTAQEGNIIKREWIKFYKGGVIPFKVTREIQSWDTSFKGSDGSDFVVGGHVATSGTEFALTDLVRGRMNFTAAKTAIRAFSGKHPKALKKVIEDKANGPALIEDLKREISGLVPYSPKDSKVARLNAVAPIFEAGNFYLPHPDDAPWVSDYIEELVTFPTGAHDDQVDMTTQALLELRSNKGDVLNKLSKW